MGHFKLRDVNFWHLSHLTHFQIAWLFGMVCPYKKNNPKRCSTKGWNPFHCVMIWKEYAGCTLRLTFTKIHWYWNSCNFPYKMDVHHIHHNWQPIHQSVTLIVTVEPIGQSGQFAKQKILSNSLLWFNLHKIYFQCFTCVIKDILEIDHSTWFGR